MNDRQARENLPLYADGELDPQQTAELEALLNGSAELREELKRWKALRRCANRVVSAAAVPPGLEDAIRAELRRRVLTARRRPLRLFGGITAVAAAIVLTVVLWPGGPPAAAPVLIAPNEFAEIYLMCACSKRHQGITDVDLGDLGAVRETLAQRKGRAVLIPDLRELGFELDGICECFHVDEVQVVHAFYRRETPELAVVSFFSVDHKIRLLGYDQDAGSSRVHEGYQTARSEDVTVSKWDEQGDSFAICSRMTAEQLRDLTDGVKVASRQQVFAKLITPK